MDTKFHWKPGKSTFFTWLLWIGIIILILVEVGVLWQWFNKSSILRSVSGLMLKLVLAAVFIGGPIVGGVGFVRWMRGRSSLRVTEDGTLTVKKGIGENEFNLQLVESIHVHNSGAVLTPYIGILGAWIRPQFKTKLTVKAPSGEKDTVHQGGMDDDDLESFQTTLEEFEVELSTEE